MLLVAFAVVTHLDRLAATWTAPHFYDPRQNLRVFLPDPGGPLPQGRAVPQQHPCRGRHALHEHPPQDSCVIRERLEMLILHPSKSGSRSETSCKDNWELTAPLWRNINSFSSVPSVEKEWLSLVVTSHWAMCTSSFDQDGCTSSFLYRVQQHHLRLRKAESKS